MSTGVAITKTAMRVATNLRSFQDEASSDHPQDVIHEGTSYRRLDPDYYAWLRRRMERAQQAHEAGRLASSTWQILRDRFKAVHDWAIVHLGESSLVSALADLDEKTYCPPQHDHAIGVVESWDERAAILEHDGEMAMADAESAAANITSRQLTRSDVMSFIALGVEVHVKSSAGEFVLVPEYTDNDRIEISADDLRKLSVVMGVFPGSEITDVSPWPDPWGDELEHIPTPAPVPAPAPKSAHLPKRQGKPTATTQSQTTQQPQQARLF